MSSASAIEAQLLDGGIEMRCRNVCAASVERRELLLERGDDVMRVGVARRACQLVFQTRFPLELYGSSTPRDQRGTQ